MRKLILIALLFLSFGVSAQVTYTPMNGGYQYKYGKFDSGLAVPFHDTTLMRSIIRPGLIVVRPQDSLFYGYNGQRWSRLGDSTGAVSSLKVDSVTVSGDTLKYWINGTSVGWLLPATYQWKYTGNVGICDACFLGTLDAADLVFKVDNTESGRLTNLGRTSFGYNSVTSGNASTAIGYNATTTNRHSTAIGQGSLATGDHSTALGSLSAAVIDYAVALGDSSTAKVGIRTGSPAYPLDVRGTVKIADGTEGNGKVFTSDANGVGSWQTVVGTGSVTSISQGYGIVNTPNPITTTGTVTVDTATLSGKWVRVGDTTSMLYPYPRKVNTVTNIFRTPGVDSIYYTINGVNYAIKDSAGGSGGTVLDTTNIYSQLSLKALKSTTLTINGTAFDLSANRTWNVGTLTNFTAGNLSPLFTASVANPTTAPAFSFTGSNINQYEILGRKASGAGAYSFLAADSSLILGLHSENYYNTKYVSPGTFLGTIYDSTSWTNTVGFTIVGSPTTSVSSNKILVSAGNQSISTTVGTANSAFNQVLKITSYGGTMLEKSKVTLKFKVNVSPGATTYGMAIGTYSINTASGISNSMAYFNMSNGTGTGTVSLLAGTGNTTVAVSPTALSFSQNDYIVLTYERIGDKILATARNQTTNSSPVTAIYAYDPTSASNVLLPNTSNFAIANIGGAYVIDSLNITSNETKYANVMFVGDSKFSGYTAGYDVGIPQLFNRYYGGSISCSGQGDRTQDVLNHIAQIIALAPKTVVLCIGRNDISGGVSSGTWQANIASIVSQLEAVGTTVRLLDAIYETSISQAALLSYIPATYPTKYIGTYAPGNFAGSVANDAVHPSYTGSKVVSNIIYQSLLLTDNGKYLNKKYEGLIPNTTFDSARVYGTLRVGTNTTAFDPDSWTPGDIIVGLNGALTSWYGANTQKNRLVISNNSNAGMDFRTYTGSAYPNSTGFRWYGGGTSTGSQTKWMDLNGSGVLKLGSGTGDWSGGASGDFMMYYTNKIIGASSSSLNDQANLCLFDNTASTVFRNYRDVGQFKFFTSGGASGSQLQALTILPSGHTTLGGAVILKNYTVATLPTGVTGMMCYVTDATAPTYNATLVGGGAVTTVAFYNGANWTAH